MGCFDHQSYSIGRVRDSLRVHLPKKKEMAVNTRPAGWLVIGMDSEMNPGRFHPGWSPQKWW